MIQVLHNHPSAAVEGQAHPLTPSHEWEGGK
jgi:hypothetical protein